VLVDDRQLLELEQLHDAGLRRTAAAVSTAVLVLEAGHPMTGQIRDRLWVSPEPVRSDKGER
jgi:hypothetical protein